MLAFDNAWWITSAIGLASLLRVWMANLVRLPKWASWALAGLVLAVGAWRFLVAYHAQAVMLTPTPGVLRLTVIVALGVAVAVLYLFDYERAQAYKASILEFIDSVLIALLLVFCILRPFVIQAFFIPSGSMLDTLQINDRIIVNKFVFFFREPKHGEIIVFRAPPQADPGKKDFIKRVIGLPGDHISVHDQKVWRNGQPLDEPYVRETILYNWPVLGRDKFAPDVLADSKTGGRDWPIIGPDGLPARVGEVVVPKGGVLVMGDNRNDSADSHAWPQWDPTARREPFVPRENVLGEARLIFWPLRRMRLVE